MSYLEYTVKYVPAGPRKILYLNWPLALVVAAVAGVGFLMLFWWVWVLVWERVMWRERTMGRERVM